MRTPETDTLRRGEKTFCKYIGKLQKTLIKNKISYDYEDGVFTLYIEKENCEYYHERTLYVEDGLYVLNNNEYTREYYVAEYRDLQEIIDYLFTMYNSIYTNGLILTRNQKEE